MRPSLRPGAYERELEQQLAEAEARVEVLERYLRYVRLTRGVSAT